MSVACISFEFETALGETLQVEMVDDHAGENVLTFEVYQTNSATLGQVEIKNSTSRYLLVNRA